MIYPPNIPPQQFNKLQALVSLETQNARGYLSAPAVAILESTSKVFFSALDTGSIDAGAFAISFVGDIVGAIAPQLAGVIPIVGGIVSALIDAGAAESADKSATAAGSLCEQRYNRIGAINPPGQEMRGADAFVRMAAWNPGEPEEPRATQFAIAAWSVTECAFSYKRKFPPVTINFGRNRALQSLARRLRQLTSAQFMRADTDGGNLTMLAWLDVLGARLSTLDATRVKALYVAEGQGDPSDMWDPEFGIDADSTAYPCMASGCRYPLPQKAAAVKFLTGQTSDPAAWLVQNVVTDVGYLGSGLGCNPFLDLLPSLYDAAKTWQFEISNPYIGGSEFKTELMSRVTEALRRRPPRWWRGRAWTVNQTKGRA